MGNYIIFWPLNLTDMQSLKMIPINIMLCSIFNFSFYLGTCPLGSNVCLANLVNSAVFTSQCFGIFGVSELNTKASDNYCLVIHVVASYDFFVHILCIYFD